jgi:hypothetical protein
MAALLIASLLLRCKRRVPVAPSVPCFACHMTASLIASLLLRCKWRRRSLRFACHMTASLIASLLLRCNGVCLWRRRSLRFARHMTASLGASLRLRCIPRVPVAPSVPLFCSSHDGVAHCFASLALHTACACGAVGPFASLVTWQRRSLLRFSCVANGVCLWRRRSLRFACHMTASLIASLLLRCKRRVPVAPSVPSLRSSHDGVAHCFASLALQTACACGAVGPFASPVT